MKDFRECVSQCNLTEIPTMGRDFTWTNGHLYSKIDKTLINNEWVINMSPRQSEDNGPHVLRPFTPKHRVSRTWGRQQETFQVLQLLSTTS